MEPSVKAKRRVFWFPVRASLMNNAALCGSVPIQSREICEAFSPGRLKLRAITPIISACVPPRPRRVGGANWYRRRGYYLKEISKTGGQGTIRRYNSQTGRAVKRKRGKMSYARRRKTA